MQWLERFFWFVVGAMATLGVLAWMVKVAVTHRPNSGAERAEQ